MKLYLVNYTWTWVDRNNIEHQDIWTFAHKNQEELDKTIKHYIKAFEECEFKVVSYSSRVIHITDNNYKVSVQDLRNGGFD